MGVNGVQWIKFYTRKWLYGSGRAMTPEKRGIWADLLALAAEAKMRDGTLRFDVGTPMTRKYISAVLNIEVSLLDACLDSFSKDINTDDGKPRINIWEDGTIELTNFVRYQQVDEKVLEKKEARKRAVEKARQTRKTQDTNAVAQTRAINDFNTLIRKKKEE